MPEQATFGTPITETWGDVDLVDETPDYSLRRAYNVPDSEYDRWSLHPDLAGERIDIDDDLGDLDVYRVHALTGYHFDHGYGDHSRIGNVQFRVTVHTVGRPSDRMKDVVESGLYRLQTLFNSSDPELHDDYQGYMVGFNFFKGWANTEIRRVSQQEIDGIGIPSWEVEVYLENGELSGEARGFFDPWQIAATAESLDWTRTLENLEDHYGTQKAFAENLGVSPSTIRAWKRDNDRFRRSEHYNRVYGRARSHDARVYRGEGRTTDWLATIGALENHYGTQKALAEEVGVTPRTIRGWKEGLRGDEGRRTRDIRASPSFDDLREVADDEGMRVYTRVQRAITERASYEYDIRRDVAVDRHLGKYPAPPRILRDVRSETTFEYADQEIQRYREVRLPW